MAALLKPPIFFARAEQSTALDLSSVPASRDYGGSSSQSKRDFVFVVNPKGANGRTGREWKKLLPFIRERLGPQCNIIRCLNFTSNLRAILDSENAIFYLNDPRTIQRVSKLLENTAMLKMMIIKYDGQDDVCEHTMKMIDGRLTKEMEMKKFEICESMTSGPFHAVDITREAIREGADAVIAVGGDGTLHEVVNGFFWAGNPVLSNDQGPEHLTTLGLIPLGTGSDFARTFGWKNDPYEAVERIARGLRSKIDVGVISGNNREQHFFINVADIHLSAKAGYYASKYKRFGNLCYVIGALRAFMGHNNWDLKIRVDGGDWELCHKVTALCIGNAKFFGGGMKIAPTADPCSGNLEVVILQDFKWYDFVLKLHKLYNGSHLSEKNVHTRSVKSIEIAEVTSRGDIYVQSDGEHFGFLPTRFSILPAAIGFYC